MHIGNVTTIAESDKLATETKTSFNKSRSLLAT